MSTRTLSEKLRALRTDSHLSQKELGKYLGLSSRQIQRYEKGKTLPGPRTIRAYAKLFGTNTIDLLDQRFEFGSKQLFKKLKPYVEAHLAATSKEVYAAGQAVLRMKQRACGGPWGADAIERLENELQEKLVYFKKACDDWEQAHYM